MTLHHEDPWLTVHGGDCREVMAGMEPESVDAIVTDPPYMLRFMGKTWDSPTQMGGWYQPPGTRGRRDLSDDPKLGLMQEWHQRWAEAAYRVAKPSAYLLAFGGTRTVHRLTSAIEDAGWIIRDVLVWAYACLSDDTEVLTSEGWVRYHSTNEGQLAAGFDTATGELRWEPIEGVHVYAHDGLMAEVGPQLVTLNHRVVLEASPQPQVPLPGNADLRRLWERLPDVRSVPGSASEDVLEGMPVAAAVGAAHGEGQATRPAQGPDRGVRGLRQGSLETGRMAAQNRGADVLAEVQRRPPPTEPQLPPGHAGGLDAGVATLGVREDDRPAQSSLEGRRYRVQEARELLGSPLRSLAGVGASDGETGRLRHGASADRGRGVRLPPDQDGMREPREPRSDRQHPGEPDALARQSDAQALRMGQVPTGDSEPDTVRLVDGYRGVVWCITVPSGAFVARRNGVVFVTGNSGFPKSKASLKPAWEPIVMARKPGPLRMLAIDACRIGYQSDADYDRNANFVRERKTPVLWGASTGIVEPNPAGRWPANVILTETPDGGGIFDGGWEGVVGGGETSVLGHYKELDRPTTYGEIVVTNGPADRTVRERSAYSGDSGTYSRFFLVPKADRGDREPVLGGLPERERLGDSTQARRCRVCGERFVDPATQMPKCGHDDREWVTGKPRANSHPTVKPTELMRHLVRLVTPTGGVVLDPFAGSGSTLIAAEQEGFAWIGVEREAEYVAIAEARLNGTQRGLGLPA